MKASASTANLSPRQVLWLAGSLAIVGAVVVLVIYHALFDRRVY